MLSRPFGFFPKLVDIFSLFQHQGLAPQSVKAAPAVHDSFVQFNFVDITFNNPIIIVVNDSILYNLNVAR